jgi:phage-related protein
VNNTRSISWVKAARKSFEDFPQTAQLELLRALTIAAEGQKADIAKPFKGSGSGVFEIALRHRGEAYRVIYAVQLDTALWVIHAFQKKAKVGIATPRFEVQVIQERLKWLKEIVSCTKR